MSRQSLALHGCSMIYHHRLVWDLFLADLGDVTFESLEADAIYRGPVAWDLFILSAFLHSVHGEIFQLDQFVKSLIMYMIDDYASINTPEIAQLLYAERATSKRCACKLCDQLGTISRYHRKV